MKREFGVFSRNYYNTFEIFAETHCQRWLKKRGIASRGLGYFFPLLQVPGCSFTFHARCDDVPVSFPSWSSMWTGVGQAAHGIEDNAFLGGPAAPSVRRVGKTRPGMYSYPEILG